VEVSCNSEEAVVAMAVCGVELFADENPPVYIPPTY